MSAETNAQIIKAKMNREGGGVIKFQPCWSRGPAIRVTGRHGGHTIKATFHSWPEVSRALMAIMDEGATS
jgi:hypothetical protein